MKSIKVLGVCALLAANGSVCNGNNESTGRLASLRQAGSRVVSTLNERKWWIAGTALAWDVVTGLTLTTGTANWMHPGVKAVQTATPLVRALLAAKAVKSN